MERDMTNAQVVAELESWSFRHWFTPQNVVSIVAFIVGATVLWMSATSGIAQNTRLVADLDAELQAEAAKRQKQVEAEAVNRQKQVERSEERLNKKLDDLKSDITTKFAEQNADIKQIQSMLIQMIQDNKNARP